MFRNLRFLIFWMIICLVGLVSVTYAQTPDPVQISINPPLAQPDERVTIVIQFTSDAPSRLQTTLDPRLQDVTLVSSSIEGATLANNQLLLEDIPADQSGQVTLSARIAGNSGEVLTATAMLEGATTYISSPANLTILPGQLPATGERRSPLLTVGYVVLIAVAIGCMLVMGLRTRQRMQRDFYRRRLLG